MDMSSDREAAIELVSKFLRLMEARDLASAETLLGPGFKMTFPGGVEMRHFAELIEWASGRYRSVAKTFDSFDVADLAAGPDGQPGWVVYSLGSLHGERLDGSAFSGIRYIDRFEIRVDDAGEGRLVDHQVWNDLAEVEGARPAPT